VVARRLQTDHVGHRPTRHQQPTGGIRQAETTREPGHQVLLDLAGRRRKLPAAHVHVDAGGKHLGDRARHRAAAGDVAEEARVAAVHPPIDQHVAQVLDQLLIGEAPFRHAAHNRVAYLR
jgi:hypothetical protein